jgi:hypothetical protein
MSKAKAQRKAAKQYIETARADAPVALALAAAYLKIEYQAAWKLKDHGVLEVVKDVPNAAPKAVFVTAGSLVAYRWKQLARRQPESGHLHADLLGLPTVKDAATPLAQAKQDEMLPLGEARQVLGCTASRLEELIQRGTLPVQWVDGEHMVRVGDVRQYKTLIDRDRPR